MLLTAIFSLSYFCLWTLSQLRFRLKKLELLKSIFPHVSADEPSTVRGFVHPQGWSLRLVCSCQSLLAILFSQCVFRVTLCLPALPPPASHVLLTRGKCVWVVPPMTGILISSPESLLPPQSSLVKFKAETLYFEGVMVANTFQHFLGIVILLSLFPALHHRANLIIKRWNVTRKGAAFLFHHSLKP